MGCPPQSETALGKPSPRELTKYGVKKISATMHQDETLAL
jgi:hypothetical protein